MDEAIKNLVLLVWTFSAININTQNENIDSVVIENGKEVAPITQVVATARTNEKNSKKKHTYRLEDKTNAGRKFANGII